MKIKSILTLVLLFTMSFSIVHEYVFAFYDTDHCNAKEYVAELQAPSHHGDICDVHFEYHIPYILPSQSIAPQSSEPKDSLFSNLKESYISYIASQLYQPPIV